METRDWQAGMNEVVRSFDEAHPYGVGYASLENGERVCVAVAETCEQRARALVSSADPGCPTVVVVDNRGAHLAGEPVVLDRAFNAEIRANLANIGWAMPDGSFPIGDPWDLQEAVNAFRSAADPDAVRKHIEARAVAMGQERPLLPDDAGAPLVASS